MKKLIIIILILIIAGLWFFPERTKEIIGIGIDQAKSLTGYVVGQ